jgi:hypothetical protein
MFEKEIILKEWHGDSSSSVAWSGKLAANAGFKVFRYSRTRSHSLKAVSALAPLTCYLDCLTAASLANVSTDGPRT